jgi:sugar lactone lactonase YvrE
MRLTVLAVLAVFCTTLQAQYNIYTIAGGGPANGTPALSFALAQPYGVAADTSGNIYVTSLIGNRIYKIDAPGNVSVFAGSGTQGYSGDGGLATDAALNHPQGIAVDSAGTVYFIDAVSQVVRSISNGLIATVAGNGTPGFSGDGGPATAAQFVSPAGIAVDSAGNLYIADSGNQRIRKVSGGVINTVAGNGTFGFTGDNGPATNAELHSPSGVAVDGAGNLYIADLGNFRIRKVTSGVITTVAGTGVPGKTGDNGPATSATLNATGVAVDTSSNFYVVDNSGLIRKVAAGIITSVAGIGNPGFSGDTGPATSARLGFIYTAALDNTGHLYIADNSNNRVRKVTNGVINTYAGNGQASFSGDAGPAEGAQFSWPVSSGSCVAVDNAGTVFVADTNNYRIRKIRSGVITTVAGNGTNGFSGDNGPAINAQMNAPTCVAVDTSGNLYIADSFNSRVRKVSGGIITTVAGGGTLTGEGVAATSANLGIPQGLAVDNAGNLYISIYPTTVRKVSNGVINTVAGNGTNGHAGDNGPAIAAELAYPYGLAVDTAGNLYIAENGTYIRKVTPGAGGIITTVAGGGQSFGDGGPATSAFLNIATSVAVDSAGKLYIPEYSAHRIREVSNGVITTIAGTGVSGFSGDGGHATSAQLSGPSAVATDTFGNLYFEDINNDRIRFLTLVPTNLITLSPISAPVGTPSLTLTANGTGFFIGSVVMWNGAPLPTTFISATKLTAVVSGSLLNALGTANVSVSGSNSVAFRIVPPAVNALSPSLIGPGASQFTLTVNGSNFFNGSVVQFAGTSLSTSFVNSGQLTAIVPSSLLNTSGTVDVLVVNAGPSSNKVAFVIGTPALSCTASYPLAPQLRFEGSAELLGNLVVTCAGGNPGQNVNSNISVAANVNLTSRLLSSTTQATEALLVIGNPSPAQQVLNTNIFQGSLTSLNTIMFSNVSIPAPGFSSQTVLTIVNLRGDVHQLGQFSAKNPPALNLSVTASGGITIGAPQLTAGFPMPTRFLVNGAITSQADQRIIPISFTEGSAGDFKTRTAESGFVTAVLPKAGLADSATRLRLQLSGVPAGVNLYVPVFPDNATAGTSAQLVSTDNNGAGPASFLAGSSMFGGTYAQIPIGGGTGVAVWEVTAANPQAIESLQFHVVLTGMTQTGLGSIVLTGSLAPLSAVTTATSNDPLPRFATESVTNFVDLTLTSNSVATGPNGTLALPGRRLSELAIPRALGDPQVQVGSNLSFVYTLLNNGPAPAPQVTVATNLPSTLSYLSCVTSTGGFCVAGTNPDGSTTVQGVFTDMLEPGSNPSFMVHATPLPGAVGHSLTVSSSLSSGKTDAFPDDNTLFTTFAVVNTPVTVTVNFASNPAGLKVNPPITVDQNSTISFSAQTPQSDPLGAPGKQYVFNTWSDGNVSASRSGVTPPIGGGTFTASFDTQYQLTTTASPSTRGSVSLAPSAAGNFYTADSLIQLTAVPAAGSVFTGFTGDVTSTSNPLSVVMPAAPLNIRANFVAGALAVSPSALQFGAVPGGALLTSSQSISVQTPPGVAWTATANQNFISVSPASGTGSGSFAVSIVTSALPLSGSVSGTVTVSAAGLPSVTVNVTAAVGASTQPFGVFDTPVDKTANIAGAIPVTGWALDSIEVVKVDIWREPVPGETTGSNGLVYIGDAVFVYGARPDVQAANPTLPLNTRGGWGYQMLTNFLPNAAGSGPTGNGVYKLHAIAHNKAGVAVDLGTKTITVDNAHAAKPFGTIDTPSQGGTASGNAYLNFGWALTQNPNIVPIDGSTITVVVDGQLVGHPTYNNFRSDIATLFPGYMNSGGAVGFYYLDTTKLSNGVHTISWNVYDNLGHGDGLGSRYFNVFNSGSTSTEMGEPVGQPLPHGRGSDEHTSEKQPSEKQRSDKQPSEKQPSDKPSSGRAVTVRERFPTFLEIEEVGRIEIPLGAISGYQLVAGKRVPLPIGSSLNGGVFYWQPGPGFLGDYTLVFERPDGTEAQVRVKIRPKTYAGPSVH